MSFKKWIDFLLNVEYLNVTKGCKVRVGKKERKKSKRKKEKKIKLVIENPKNRVFQKALGCPKIVVSSSKAPRSKLLECAVNLRYWAAQ